MTEWDFAFWSENAQWMHSQMLMVQQANSLGLLGGSGNEAPPQPPRPRKRK